MGAGAASQGTAHLVDNNNFFPLTPAKTTSLKAKQQIYLP
jgi:hypothetical protein